MPNWNKKAKVEEKEEGWNVDFLPKRDKIHFHHLVTLFQSQGHTHHRAVMLTWYRYFQRHTDKLQYAVLNACQKT